MYKWRVGNGKNYDENYLPVWADKRKKKKRNIKATKRNVYHIINVISMKKTRKII